MGFQQGLSGLNASSKALDTIGNNIANANTVGYKGVQHNSLMFLRRHSTVQELRRLVLAQR
jgi:flagellar hook protein FlgE